jgi:hypothetical protein
LYYNPFISSRAATILWGRFTNLRPISKSACRQSLQTPANGTAVCGFAAMRARLTCGRLAIGLPPAVRKIQAAGAGLLAAPTTPAGGGSHGEQCKQRDAHQRESDRRRNLQLVRATSAGQSGRSSSFTVQAAATVPTIANYSLDGGAHDSQRIAARAGFGSFGVSFQP